MEWLNEKTVSRLDGLLLAGMLLAFAIGRAPGPAAWWTSVVIAAVALCLSGWRTLQLLFKWRFGT